MVHLSTHNRFEDCSGVEQLEQHRSAAIIGSSEAFVTDTIAEAFNVLRSSFKPIPKVFHHDDTIVNLNSFVSLPHRLLGVERL